MLLDAGHWRGRGSFRASDQSLGVQLGASIDIADDVQGTPGLLINAQLDIASGGDADGPAMLVWIVPDENGTYTVTVKCGELGVQGTAKLDSEPHLALLWSEDGNAHVACTLFALPDKHGLRGFARIGTTTWTWELALEPTGRRIRRAPTLARTRSSEGAGRGQGKVVSLLDRLRR